MDKRIIASVFLILAISSFVIAQSQIERGKITEFQEEVASGTIAPGECFVVIKEDKERFISSELSRRGWIRITEIIKDIEICNVDGTIKKDYNTQVITCEKSPDLKQVSCSIPIPTTTTTTTSTTSTTTTTLHECIPFENPCAGQILPCCPGLQCTNGFCV